MVLGRIVMKLNTDVAYGKPESISWAHGYAFATHRDLDIDTTYNPTTTDTLRVFTEHRFG